MNLNELCKCLFIIHKILFQAINRMGCYYSGPYVVSTFHPINAKLGRGVCRVSTNFRSSLLTVLINSVVQVIYAVIVKQTQLSSKYDNSKQARPFFLYTFLRSSQ